MKVLVLFHCYFILTMYSIEAQKSDNSITTQKYNLTICSFEKEPYFINCPVGYTFDILNATLYDFQTCTNTDTSLVVVQKILQRLCYTETSCPIYKLDITRFYPNYDNLDTLGAIILWNCEKASKLELNFFM